MSRYRYYFFDDHGSLKAADDGAQVTDFAAMDHARDLLIRARDVAAVQIWRGDIFVTDLDRAKALGT